MGQKQDFGVGYGSWLLGTPCFLVDLQAVMHIDIYVMYLQDVKLLVDDIAALKPTVFCAVPRVLDRIYSGKFYMSVKT